MEPSNPDVNVESDLSDSWTILDKESTEIDDSVHCEGNESSNEAAVRAETESTQSISNVPESSDDKLPEEISGAIQNEGTESLDSDGISIISESEEEELKLLPCNSTEIEDRPCSRSSNKYFDETDTASQHSMQDIPVSAKKKYKHRPNSNLNTSLNVLLIVAWAAVIGLGMGHFLGLQEECPNQPERTKVESQTEELSIGLLRKLELENTALKEQFAHLQKRIEELNQKKTISSCKDPPLIMPDDHRPADLDKGSCPEKSSEMELEVLSNDAFSYDNLISDIRVTGDGHMKNPDERVSQSVAKTTMEVSYQTEYDDDLDDLSSEKTVLNRNMVLEKLEQSLDDVASIFREKLDPSKITIENSKEVLSNTISVLSGLVENLKEKVMTIQESLGTDSLDFKKPIEAISKMEEILQKTSDKMQEITLDAFKEGKPLHSISNKVTTKLQAINKKLEEKWCQVKKHLSNQNVIWNWIDSQIFQNCNEENRIISEQTKNKQNEKVSPTCNGEECPYEGLEGKEKYKVPKSNKKSRDESKNTEYKSKQKFESENLDKVKEKYKKKGWINPHSFDIQPERVVNVETGKKKDKNFSKNGKKDGKGDMRLEKNDGKYNKLNKSGDWMEAMFNNRAERRRDERRSDWYFSRARSRTKIRDSVPSRWYFRRGETKI